MLFNVRCAVRSAIRGFTKNLLLCLVCVLFSVLITLLTVITKSNESQLQEIYETMEVSAMFIDNSINLGTSYMGIGPVPSNLISMSPFVKDHMFTYLRTIQTPFEKLESGNFQLYGTSNINMTDLFIDGYFTVEYGEGYDDSIFRETNCLAIVSKEFAELNNLQIGDKVTVGFGRMLTDKWLVYNKNLVIAGFYSSTKTNLMVNLNSIYVSVGTAQVITSEYMYYLEFNNTSETETVIKDVDYMRLNEDFVTVKFEDGVFSTVSYDDEEMTDRLSEFHARIFGVLDITMTDGYGGEFTIEYAPGFDDSLFQQNALKILVSKEFAEANNLSLNDIVIFDYIKPSRNPMASFEIAGIIHYKEETTSAFYNRIYLPYPEMVNSSRYRLGFVVEQPFYDEAVFIIGDLGNIDEFKAEMMKINPTSGSRFVVLDENFKAAVNPLKNTLTLIDGLQSVIYYIIAVIVFFMSYLALRSKLTDIAIMTALGAGRLRVSLVLFIESLIISLIGTTLGLFVAILTSVINYGSVFQPISAFLPQLGIFMLSFTAGTIMSILSVVNIRPIEILTKKE